MKKLKGLKNAHSSNAKIGMGDSYGSGIKNKFGRVRESMMDISVSTAKIKKSKPLA